MNILFDVCYSPTNIQAPDSRLEVGKVYGVVAVIESPECFWRQYALQGVKGFFPVKDFYSKRENFLAVSQSVYQPQEGTSIDVYGISVWDSTKNEWFPAYSNRKIEKVVPHDKNFYDIITEFAVYHTKFINL